MLSENESNNSQRSTHTDPEKSKAKRNISSDNLPTNSMKTGTSTLVHLFTEIHILLLLTIMK